MYVLLLNGSPRKDWNTDRLLMEAERGAAESGAQTERIQLFDLDAYKDCISCFACKLKGNKCGGICVVRDGLRPLLEKAAMADAIILGSPVYYGDITAEALAFMHRFLFAAMRYEFDPATGKPVVQLPGTRKCALIMTMNASEATIQSGYGKHFETIADSIRFVFGSCELLFSCDTYQFSDYSKYYAGAFNAEEKALHHEKQFPVDLQNAYDLGARLAQND